LHTAPKYTQYLKQEPNLKLASNFSYTLSLLVGKLSKRLLRFLQNKRTAGFAAAVRIGGSVFIEKDGADPNYFPEKNKNFFIIGANFGPYRTKEFFDAKKEKIKASVDCCFRDRYSYELFSDLPQVRYAPDVLFVYPFLPPRKNREHIGVSVIDFTNHGKLSAYAAAYERGIKKICDYWVAQHRMVKLLCFCADEGDTSAAERVIASCNDPDQIETIVYSGDTESFLAEINNCEILYATRFHAMILGWAMYKTIVPVIYSEKQTNVIEDIGFEGIVWNISHGDPFSETMLSPQNNRMDEALIERTKIRAQEQFSGLDAFFGANS
jgi:colanic acid/amylovoran biosynthesis protein